MMPVGTYISRNAWDARKPKSITPLVHSQQRGTGVHYSGGASEARLNHAECANVVRSIQHFHMDTRGWADIAYSFLPCNHGAIFVGRGRGIRTAANGTNSGNDGYHAVCFLGGDRDGRADVTPEGFAALKIAIRDCNAWAGVKEVRPHSSFKSTECPGDEIRAWIARGLPTEDEDMTTDELDRYLASDRGRGRLERAVDLLMSQGLTGDRNGAIRGWAVRLENVEGLATETRAAVAEILSILKAE